ncbi:MAG: pantetheine-phosphate adenylyltransferase [Bacteriovoracaceae bacterium]
MVSKKREHELKTALYAGSFDPFTNGHEDIVSRALKIFDHVTIVIAIAPNKTPLFEGVQRVKMIRELYKDNKKVFVTTWDGLVVDFARENKIGSIVRGLRPTGDFEIEFQMASMNRKLYPECDTVFLMTGEKHYYVSSSLVKEIYNYGGEVSRFVPKHIYNYMLKFRKKKKSE